MLLSALKYLNGAIIQRERILDDMGDGGLSLDEKTRRLFLDLHFYIICCARVRHLLSAMAARDGDRELIGIANRLKKKTSSINTARVYLEHIENKIPLDDDSEWSEVTPQRYSFAGRDFDISEEGLGFFITAFAETIKVLAPKNENI